MPLQLILFEVSVPPVFFASQAVQWRNPVWYPGSINHSWIRQQESISMSAFSVDLCWFYMQSQNNSLGQCKDGKELKITCVYIFKFVCIYIWITYYRFLISPNGCLIHQLSWLRLNTLATNPSLFSKKRYLRFCRKSFWKKKLNMLEYQLKLDTFPCYSSFMLT